MGSENYINAIKYLKKRNEDLEFQQELVKKAVASLEAAKYRFGDFIFTKDGHKGYITGVYTTSYVIFNNTYDSSNRNQAYSGYDFPEDLTLESILKSPDKDETFYTCDIFIPSDINQNNKLYEKINKVIIKQENIIPYNDNSRLLYER